MENPVIKIELKPFDWLLEVLALITVAFILIVSCSAYHHLSTITYLSYPLKKHNTPGPGLPIGIAFLSLFLYTGLTLLSRIPQNFKYPVVITANNAERQYRSSLVLLRIVKLAMVLIFLFLIYLIAR